MAPPIFEYCSTFLGSAQLILFSLLSKISKKKTTLNVKNSIKEAKFESTTNLTKD
jgi:hypothetical protein